MKERKKITISLSKKDYNYIKTEADKIGLTPSMYVKMIIIKNLSITEKPINPKY